MTTTTAILRSNLEHLLHKYTLVPYNRVSLYVVKVDPEIYLCQLVELGEIFRVKLNGLCYTNKCICGNRVGKIEICTLARVYDYLKMVTSS